LPRPSNPKARLRRPDHSLQSRSDLESLLNTGKHWRTFKVFPRATGHASGCVSLHLSAKSSESGVAGCSFDLHSPENYRKGSPLWTYLPGLSNVLALEKNLKLFWHFRASLCASLRVGLHGDESQRTSHWSGKALRYSVREGFEPSEPVFPVQRFSKAPLSTAQPPHQNFAVGTLYLWIGGVN
jgi:hypothetical protein